MENQILLLKQLRPVCYTGDTFLENLFCIVFGVLSTFNA